ncbi:CBS domain-containing protein [Streptacidiphilus monticola]|jgi:CBS domain-containing protein|uniref:CBS domain-containing protein n=1 Tax=Streptacidiphilus monticola TaxID=2161674 RepID=A0ABW1G830_9ACTN
MTKARDVMHAGAVCVGENESLLDAARMMRDHQVGALPICGENQKLMGIITDRDIVLRCLAEGKDPGATKARDLAGHLHCVRADDDMETVLRKMEQHQIRRIPVIDNERLVGMISEVDLASGHREGQRLTDQQILEFMDKMYMTQ